MVLAIDADISCRWHELRDAERYTRQMAHLH